MVGNLPLDSCLFLKGELFLDNQNCRNVLPYLLLKQNMLL